MSRTDSSTVKYHIKNYDEPARRFANVDTAAGRATQLLANHPAAALGTLSAAPQLHWDFANSTLQVRSGPVAELAGAELRFNVPGGKPGRMFMEVVTDEVVNHAKSLWDRRQEAAAMVTALQAAIDRSYERDPSNPRRPSIGAIGLTPDELGEGRFRIVLEVKILGSGMDWSVERIRGRSHDEIMSSLMDKTNEHAKFVDMLAELRANRICGHIDDTGRRVLDAVGMKLDDASARLVRRNELVFNFDADGAEHLCHLHWSNGILRCDLSKIDPEWSLQSGVLWLKRHVMPATLFDSLPGRRLGAVFANDLLPVDAVITHAEARPDNLKVLWLAIPTIRLPDADDALGDMMRARELAPALST